MNMKKTAFIIFFILSVLYSFKLIPDANSSVYVVPVHGVIELGLSGFIDRACKEAKSGGAGLVIFDIDTFGGRIDAATEICDSLAGLGDIPTCGFVTGEAWSAGALIALACKTIIMTPGSSIGSAEPRGGAMGEELTDEKIISAIRAKFKAVAEKNGHSVKLASAMVDKDVELILVRVSDKIEILTASEWEEKDKEYKKKVRSHIVLCEKGKLLNLTANESKDLGLAKEVLETRSGLLELLDMKDARVIEARLLWSEMLVRFITHPIVSSLLLTIGFLGLIFELKIPGWGLSGTLGLISLALFFWGHYLIGLANWIEIVLFLLGVGLLFLEIFVIPGFGITGVSGIILIIISLFLALIKHPFEIPHRELLGAFYIISYAFVLSLVIAIVGLRWIPHSWVWKKLVLVHTEESAKGYTQDRYWERFIGKEGKSITSLRPTGKIEIDGEFLDVVTEGDFLDKGTLVKIISTDGNRIIVRKA